MIWAIDVTAPETWEESRMEFWKFINRILEACPEGSHKVVILATKVNLLTNNVDSSILMNALALQVKFSLMLILTLSRSSKFLG